eukprot:jgi/Bigna1/39926/e_gw1.37.79.1
MAEGTAIDLTGTAGQSVVIVAAGCFWSVELAFQRLPGVTKTRVGYVGGNLENPTYSDVVSGRTGHAEAVEVTFDSSIVSLGQVLDYFFLIHEPTTVNRQGNDVGTQYRSAIWYSQETDEETVFEAKDRAQKRSSQKVVTEIDLLRTGAKRFWDAEDYHQQYLEKGGQSSTKGKLDPIRCYGNRGQIFSEYVYLKSWRLTRVRSEKTIF